MPTNDFRMVDVQSIRPLEGCRLWARFTDGGEGVRDLSGVIAKCGVMVEPLKSKEYFERVFLDMGAPTWPNGFYIGRDRNRAKCEVRTPNDADCRRGLWVCQQRASQAAGCNTAADSGYRPP
jgi:hypothetical protein